MRNQSLTFQKKSSCLKIQDKNQNHTIDQRLPKQQKKLSSKRNSSDIEWLQNIVNGLQKYKNSAKLYTTNAKSLALKQLNKNVIDKQPSNYKKVNKEAKKDFVKENITTVVCRKQKNHSKIINNIQIIPINNIKPTTIKIKKQQQQLKINFSQPIKQSQSTNKKIVHEVVKDKKEAQQVNFEIKVIEVQHKSVGKIVKNKQKIQKQNSIPKTSHIKTLQITQRSPQESLKINSFLNDQFKSIQQSSFVKENLSTKRLKTEQRKFNKIAKLQKNHASAQKNNYESFSKEHSLIKKYSIQILKDDIVFLFNFLDIKNRGFLSEGNCYTEGLIENIIFLFTPILNQIMSKQKIYDEKTFLKESYQVLKVKNQLYHLKKTQQEVQTKQYFQPIVNILKNSLKELKENNPNHFQSTTIKLKKTNQLDFILFKPSYQLKSTSIERSLHRKSLNVQQHHQKRHILQQIISQNPTSTNYKKYTQLNRINSIAYSYDLPIQLRQYPSAQLKHSPSIEFRHYPSKNYDIYK